jgi:sugar (pentulose or hexulose) kinase
MKWYHQVDGISGTGFVASTVIYDNQADLLKAMLS